MKICWDNLEKLIYRPDKCQWYHKSEHRLFVYEEACKNCGEPFLHGKNRKEEFCSVSCSKSGKFNNFYGKHHTNKTKKVIAESRIGKYCGKDSPNYGIPKSKETRRKMSENHADFSGKNSPNWNPNITDQDRMKSRKYPEYNEWRTAVYERDTFTCQYCGDNKGGNLIAHHIESYDNNLDLRTTLSNGITFCETHHDDFHHQYGYGNNTREQLEEFLRSK